MKKLAILGSTGSIGHSTLRIVESYPDRFGVVTLAAGNNLETALRAGPPLAPAPGFRGPAKKPPGDSANGCARPE